MRAAAEAGTSCESKGWRRLWRRLAGLARSKAGVTAVETAFVMPLFLLVTFGIVETAMLFFIATSLEGQVAAAGREIRTGQVQQSGNPATTFQTALCGGLGGLFDCTQAIIDVRNFPDWNSVNYPSFLNPDGTPNNNQFAAGGPGNIVIVRVAYNWTILTPFLGQFFGDGGGQTKQLFSSAAFRNEPYGAPTP